MPTYDDIIRALKQRRPQRVYLLTGDEPLFIDQIASFATSHLIPEEEQDFNQTILYGGDVSARDILLEALRFPMMGSQVLVLVREAQQVRDLDQLAPHLSELPEKHLSHPLLQEEGRQAQGPIQIRQRPGCCLRVPTDVRLEDP